MSCANYRRLVSQGITLLSQINPNAHPQDANCPETADAVNDFLNSSAGLVRQVRTASATAVFNFPRGLQWRYVDINQVAIGLRNCSHVVVRGIRTTSAQGVTPEHYFVVLKVDNFVWVADAYAIVLTRGVQAYVNSEPPANRMTRFQIASGYDVIVKDPLDF